MKRDRLFLTFGALFLLGLAFLYRPQRLIHAGTNRSQHTQTNSTPCCGPVHPEAPRELDFPYYSLRDGFRSTLNLVSDSPKPIDLTIAIRSLSGQTFLGTETIEPGAKLPIDLASFITKLGGDPAGAFAEGSIAVYFVGTIMWHGWYSLRRGIGTGDLSGARPDGR